MSNNPKQIIFFPLRLMVFVPDFAKKTYSQQKRIHRKIRDFYDKKAHEPLKVIEVATYLKLTTHELLEFLPECER